MKLQQYILGLLLAFLCLKSNGSNLIKPEGSSTPQKLLILIDKSASIKFTENQVNKLPDELNSLILNQTPTNSTIGVYFLNSVAMSKAHFKSTLNIPKPNLNGGGLDNDKALDLFNKQLRTARLNWKKKIKEALALKVSNSTISETDIWGSLSGMEGFFKGQTKKNLYIYSDMIHSTKTLDHHKFPPKDEAKAREMAKKDLPGMVRKYAITSKSLEGVTINIIFPGDAVSLNQNKIMEAYWKTVFQSLGARNISFD